MSYLAALVTVLAAVNWIGFIAGTILTLANPSADRFGVLALSGCVTAVLVVLMFRLLESTQQR